MATVQIVSPLEELTTGVLVAPSGGYTKNQIVKSNGLIGIILNTVAAGVAVTVVLRAPKVIATVDAAPAGGYPVGTKFYFLANSGQTLTTTSTSNFIAARVIEPAATGATTVVVLFDGTQA